MDNIISRITLYHNLYLACIGATVVFLCISIVLFIRLNIKEVIGFLTGSQAKREIQRLETEGVAKRIKEKNISVKFRKVNESPKVTITKKLEETNQKKTELLHVSKEECFKTTLLQANPVEFYTEREIMLIHTNETIE